MVLVTDDAERAGVLLVGAPDESSHTKLLGLMVGDPEDPRVQAAAAEMAGELWPWAHGEA